MTVVLFFFVLLGAIDLHALSQLRTEHVQVEVISPQQIVGPSGLLKLGVHFRLEPDWHIYWKNPGDSGAAPKFKLEQGSLRNIDWPYPQRLPVQQWTNFGYEEETVVFLDVLTDPKAPFIQLNLEWLVCKVECIPGFGKLTWPVQRGPQEIFKESTEVQYQLYEKFRARIPLPTTDWSVKTVELSTTTLLMHLIPRQIHRLQTIKDLLVYPSDGTKFQTALPAVNPKDSFLEISLPISVNAPNKLSTTELTFVARDKDGQTKAWTSSVATAPPPTPLAFVLFFAFLGGLLLNLMPCVFPVLSLKALSFLKDSDRLKRVQSAWVYTAGVITTFAIAGVTLALLRASGEAVGWGYQLQNAAVVYILSCLFFVMGLSFLGSLEFGNHLANMAAKAGKLKWLSGSFGTGVLAVIVASPCTAPFMGTALGVTILLPWYQALWIFVCLGLGLSFPMVILAYIPAMSARLPRSGRWMETFKQIMAFPLFATSLWLLWVLSQQKGDGALFVALSSFLVLAFGAWLLTLIERKSLSWLVLALFFVILPLAASNQIFRGDFEQKTASDSVWQSYDEATIAAKISTQDVFIDFTASWCITCQINKKTVLNTEAVQTLFERHRVYTVRADWTNYDPAITKALNSFDRNSVPLYVFYKSGSVRILPEILTQKMIVELFDNGE